jgi:hypothetical protein
MTRNIFRELETGARDALRTYAMLILAPFDLGRSLVSRLRRP